MAGNFFTAIGKPVYGIFISLTRQILFLLPLILILPRFFGIDGVLYSAPIADFMAAVLAFFLTFRQLNKWKVAIKKPTCRVFSFPACGISLYTRFIPCIQNQF